MDPFFSYIEQNRNTISSGLYVASNQKQFYFEEVKLPKVTLSEISLADALHTRQSTHSFKEGASINVGDLSPLLAYGYGYGRRTDNKRTFPSGGAMYSQELFLLAQNVTGIKHGIYQYDPTTHVLGLVQKTLPPKNILLEAVFYEDLIHAPAMLFIVSHKGKNIKKYGSYSYPHAFLEAGHVGQNMYLIASALEIGCCAIGSARYSKFNEILRLSGTASNHVYAIAIGPLSETI